MPGVGSVAFRYHIAKCLGSLRVEAVVGDEVLVVLVYPVHKLHPDDVLAAESFQRVRQLSAAEQDGASLIDGNDGVVAHLVREVGVE